MTLGAFLRARRGRLGLSIRQAARLIGVDHSRVSRWENDQTLPTTTVMIYALAAAYEGPEPFPKLLQALTELSIQASLRVLVEIDVIP